MYLTEVRDKHFVEDALFVTFILLFSYTLKFFQVVPVDMVIIGHLTIILYACVYKKVLVSLQIMSVIAVFYLLATAGIFLNLFSNPADYSLIKYVLQGMLLVYVLCSRSRRIHNSSTNILGLCFILLVFLFDFYSLATGSHYLSILGEGFRDQYLVISDLIAIGCLLIVAKTRLLLGMLCSVLCFGALLFFGSRSAMVFFLLSVFANLGFVLWRSGTVVKAVLLGLFVPVLAMLILFMEGQQSKFYRFFSVFTILKDHSFIERLALSKQFFDETANNHLKIVFGSGTSHEGFYVHDVFSIWQMYGIFPFIIMIVLVIVTALIILRDYKRLAWAAPLFIFLTLSSLSSRAVISVTFPFWMALCLVVINTKYSNKRVG